MTKPKKKKTPAKATTTVCYLDKLLIERDLTRADMSRELGLDQGYLSKVAHGKILPYVSTALAIAAWLEVAVEELWANPS